MLRLSWPLLIFSVVANLLMLAAPIHMLQVYDRVLSSGSGETLLYITVIVAACLMLFGFVDMLRTRLAQRNSADFTVDYADDLFAGMTNGSVPVEKSNELMRDFNTVKTFLASRSLIGLYDLPFSPFFLICLFALHVQLGLLITFGTLVLIGIAWLNKKSTAEDMERATKANGMAIGFASSVANRSEDIRAMGLLPSLVGRWGAMMGESLNAQDASASKGAFFSGLTKSVRQILQISIMAWGAWLVLSGDMSGGMIFAASMITGKVLQPIEQVIGGWDMINKALQSNQRLMAALEKSKSVEQKIAQPDPKGYLKVSGLSLQVEAGDKNLEILKDVNFSVDPGTLAAIIGPSGAGKSTLARIIAGAIAPTSGEVSLDGCLQPNWSAEQWGQFVGYLGQDILLFPGTIAENIARMAVTASEENVIRAAKLAGAHDLINSFQDGYQTKIGEAGTRLSGGQKQRIALARALYSSPKLLVLDEPNAHLDQHGENILMASLQTVRNAGVAIIVVTQRQSILKIADRILIVKDGMLVPEEVKAAAPTNMPVKRPAQAGASVPQGPIANSVRRRVVAPPLVPHAPSDLSQPHPQLVANLPSNSQPVTRASRPVSKETGV